MVDKQETQRSEEQAIKDLPEKKLSANQENEVRGGIGPVDGKKPPILPLGPVDGIK